MSEVAHHSATERKAGHDTEHGTMQSYVIGFILSLVFTFIPYYLVVNKTVTGNTLLATILGFAVIQMVIQITFFLHLGRGPKPNWNFFFFIATAGIILFITVASVLIMKHLHYNMAPSDQTKKLVNNEGIYQIGGLETGACQELKTNHQIKIKDGQAYPSHIDASKCDTLSFINEDNGEREITFGTIVRHERYAGESKLTVKKSRSKTITLSETGTYKFYDALNSEAAGQFTVSE